MFKKSFTLGFCPIGKFVFSHEDALVQKAKLENVLKVSGTSWIGIDEVLPDGIVRRQEDVEPVVRHFKTRGIDALFLPHCNFGTEGAAGMIALECGVPVLLWGPRDGAPLPDGSRLRDSLCGTFATSKVLHTLRVPFSYIVNSHPEDEIFTNGLDKFLRAARIVKSLRTMRIGMVGQRIDFFWSTIASEADLLQRFGVQVQPIELALVIDRIKKRAVEQEKAYLEEYAEMAKWFRFEGFENPLLAIRNFAFRDELLSLGREHSLDAFCVQTFSAIPELLGLFPSLGVALLNDLGFPVGPESDLHGTISSVMLEAASSKNEPSFLPDLTIRHPDNNNAVLLWHFEAPLSLRDTSNAPGPGTSTPWILPGMPPGTLEFKLKDGPVTVTRFDGDSGGYRLGFGEGRTVPGPYTRDYYTWLEVNNWQKWEEQIVRGPYIHHCSCIFDNCSDALEEACRFLPGLTPERFGI
jgi:L-fucose isomerase-like protein